MKIPDIADLSPDDCFLSWRFFLNTAKDESAIREIFEWVEDDADITIALCGGYLKMMMRKLQHLMKLTQIKIEPQLQPLQLSMLLRLNQ